MRDEVLMELVDRALEDEEFRAKAKDDPEGTLKAYGYDLTDEELAAVKEFQGRVAGLSDEELAEALASGARQQGA
jgi:hypothetical protein